MLRVDHQVVELLESLGLSKTEQSLYLSGLSRPGALVSDLISLTGVNRTTAYHALDTLKQKGFVIESKEQGKLIYEMTRPEDLSAFLDRRQVELESQRQILKQITTLFPSHNTGELDQTVIEKFEGINGVKEAVDRALYCRKKEWRIIAPEDNFFSQAEDSYAKYFMATRRKHQIKAKSLWEPGFKQNKLTIKDLIERRPRYLPKNLSVKFKSVIIIYDNKALFISSAKTPSAVIVGSKELVGTLMVMYDALWELADKPQ